MERVNKSYDRHDFLRIAIPGYIFLLVVGIFWISLKGKIVLNDWEFLLGILAAGFPIGFTIQGIYQAWHVSSSDLNELDDWESECLEKELKTINKTDLLEEVCFEDVKAPKGRKLSWCLETFLFLNKETEYRTRSHELVSRIHSFGAAFWAVLVGLIISIILIVYSYGFCILFVFPSAFKILVVSIFWAIVMWCFWRVRKHTKEVFGLMSLNFIRRKRDVIIDFISQREKVE